MTGKLTELLERVKAATGPDRELDGDIFDALVGVRAQDAKRWYGGGYASMVTTHVDAALALVDRMLPDSAYSLTNDYGGYNRAYINVSPGCEGFPPGGLSVEEIAGTMPLAIIAALLSALTAEEPS